MMAYRQSSHTSSTYQDIKVKLHRSSQDSLSVKLTKEKDGTKWSHGVEFLSACLGFSLNLHSLWLLPVAVMQNGGLVFLLMYLVMVAVCGAPLLLLEMALGQYSGMAPVHLFHHLCPLLSGLGVCQSVHALLTVMQNMAVMTWISQGVFLMFRDQKIDENLLYDKVINKDDHNLDDLGSLNSNLLLALGIVTIFVFLLVVAGHKSVGKVSMVTVPACFMILVTLTIRSFFADGGSQAVLKLLQPEWNNLTQPSIWMEATCQAIFSLQLGTGVISTYASYNKFYHNIIRDCCIIIAAHVVWVTFCILLCFSLLGVAQNPPQSGSGLWLVTITLLESGLAKLSFGWLWAGLFFILLVLVSLSSVLGYLHVLSTTLQCVSLCLVKFQAVVFLLVLGIVFALDILLMTQGGLHIYHLFYSFILQWPMLLFCLLTILITIFCHQIPFLLSDISDMSKTMLPNWIACHLAVAYYTLLPALTSASLGYFLYSLHEQSLDDPLQHFSMSLPVGWGVVVGWSLAILPLSPLVAGAVISIICKAIGGPKSKVVHLLQPSDCWYSNEQSSSTTPPSFHQTPSSSPVGGNRNKDVFYSDC